MKKLNEYFAAWASGEESWSAFSRIFKVNATELKKQLEHYALHQMTMSVFPTSPPDAAVSIEEMPLAADGLLVPGLRVAIGKDQKDGANLISTIRQRAARHSDDAFAQKVLANAEIFYGDPSTANKILRALPNYENDYEALYLDGYASLTRAANAPSSSERIALLNEAKVSFGKEFKINPYHYQTLYRYGEASLMEESPPSENTINILLEAYRLAPQVAEIGINTARALMSVQRFDDAASVLSPIARDPHGGKYADIAKTLISQAKSKSTQPKDWWTELQPEKQFF